MSYSLLYNGNVDEITVFDIDERKFNRENEAFAGLRRFAIDRANLYAPDY